MSIQQLPQKVIKLISSTQVINSISSVVKELLENSLDAGATVVDIKLERNGLDRIEVRDNGSGIGKSDINSVCLPHYTSKIHDFDDLEHLQSYGFRGEALHSLSAISQVSITTKTKNDEVASTYTYDHNGTVCEMKPSHQMDGTVITVTNLFRNVPVRKQFYENSRKGTEELKKIEKIVKQLSIIHPKLRLTLAHNKCLIWHKTSVFSLRQSLLQVYASAILKNLDDHSCTLPNMSLEMLIAKREGNLPVLCQPVNEAVLLYINRRPVKDKKIEKLVLEEMNHVYASMLPINKCPLTLISLQLAPESIDVNLEPNKTKVFIKDHEEVLKQIRETIMLHFYQQPNSSDMKELLLDGDQLQNPSKKRKMESDEDASPINTENVSKDLDVSAMRNLIIEKTNVNTEKALKELADIDFSAFEENMSFTSNVVEEKIADETVLENGNLNEVHYISTPISSELRAENYAKTEISCSDLFDDPLSPLTNCEGPESSVHSHLRQNAPVIGNENSSHRSEILPKVDELINGNEKTVIDASLSQWSRGNVIVNDRSVEGPVILFNNQNKDSNGKMKEYETHKTATKPKTLNKDRLPPTDANRSVSSQMGRKDMAGFTHFARQVRSEIIKETPGITFTKVAGELANRWRDLDEEQKNSFKQDVKLKQKSIAADVKPMYKKKTVALDVSINKILEGLKMPGSLCRRYNESRIHLIGSLETSSEWLYKIGKEIKVVNVPHLQENVLFHRYMCNSSIPLRRLEEPIKISSEILGHNLLDYLLSLERIGEDGDESFTVISDSRITKNGFKVLVNRALTVHNEIFITETPKEDDFDVIGNFLETLRLARQHEELEHCRSGSIKKMLLSKVMEVCEQKSIPDEVTEIRMLLQYWVQCMLQKKLCSHDAPISVNLHAL